MSPFQVPAIRFDARFGGASVISQVKTGGEDAFMTLVVSDGCSAAAVADGVSSWVEKGVNAGAYSSVLVHEARRALEAGSGASSQAVMDQAQRNAKVPALPSQIVYQVLCVKTQGCSPAHLFWGWTC